MNKYNTLHQIFSVFGMDAYPQNAVKKDATLPYLTYEKRFGDSAEITVHVYYKTASEAIPDAKAEEICKAFRNGGQTYQYDNGALWVTVSSPEWFSSPDEADPTLKHRIINLTLHDLAL